MEDKKRTPVTKATGRRSKLLSKSTQETLLNSAVDLFYKKGYSDTTIREVGTKSGVSNSLLYHYFKNKEEILFQIVSKTTMDLLKTLQEIDEQVEDPLERLKEKLFQHMILFGMKRVKESKIVVEDNYWLRGKRREVRLDYERQIFNIYLKDIEELVKSGKFNDLHPTVLTFSIFGIINWFFRWYKESGVLKPGKVAEDIIQMLLFGIVKQEKITGRRGTE